jgi:hypothetical protein
MSLTSDWQGYVPPNYRFSQFTAHLLHVEPSFYMAAPLEGSRNKNATRNVFTKKYGHCSLYWNSQDCSRVVYRSQVSTIWGKLRRMYRVYIYTYMYIYIYIYDMDQQTKASNNNIISDFSFSKGFCFWPVTRCWVTKTYQCFEGLRCFHLQV